MGLDALGNAIVGVNPTEQPLLADNEQYYRTLALIFDGEKFGNDALLGLDVTVVVPVLGLVDGLRPAGQTQAHAQTQARAHAQTLARTQHLDGVQFPFPL